MASNKENLSTIYIFLVLLVWQAGMKIPFLNFLHGNMQIILAVILLIIGSHYFKNKNNYQFSTSGNNVFKLILCSLILSIITAYIFGGQDFLTSFILYRHHIWLLFLPLFFKIRPSQKSISNSLFYFTITSILVCLCQMLGIFSVNAGSNIWGDEVEISQNEFGGYGIVGDRTIVFALYLFLYELAYNYNRNNLLKVLLACVAIILSAQRAMLLFALPFTLYVILFKIQIKSSKKFLFFIIFTIASLLFFSYTIDSWQALLLETTTQINDKDYNRWIALDYFLFNHNNNIITTILGNGFLSIKSIGGKLIYDLGYRGIYIDDVGMIGVWIRYGIIPIILLLYILKRVLLKKSMPLYMKLISLHIALLPTAWTLIGPHYFVLIFLIYLYYYNMNNSLCESSLNNLK